MTTTEIDTLPPTATTTTTTVPVPMSARFKYSYKKRFPLWCYGNDCRETQVTLSGAIVPNAFAERSLEERGVVDVYWECRDCSLTVKKLRP